MKFLLKLVSEGLKRGDATVTVADDVELLDSLCDQVVTGTGVAHMQGYHFVDALVEVNLSNWSKFDAQGRPIFNEHGKIIKGPNYYKPDLVSYAKKTNPTS